MRLQERELEGIQNAAAAKRLGELDPDAVAAAVAVSIVDERRLNLRDRRFFDGDVCPVDALVLCDCRRNRKCPVGDCS